MDVKELQEMADDYDSRRAELHAENWSQIRATYEVALQIALLHEDLKKPTWVAGPK